MNYQLINIHRGEHKKLAPSMVMSEFRSRGFNSYRYDSWMYGFEAGVRDSNALLNPKYINENNGDSNENK